MDVLVVAWLFLGVRVADEVEGLTERSATVSQAGGAVEDTGQALGSLDVPFVGGDLERAAQRAPNDPEPEALAGPPSRCGAGAPGPGAHRRLRAG